MKSKRLMTIGIVLALLIAVVGVVLSVSLTACGKDVITVRSEKELLKAAGTSQEKTIVLMDDVVVNGDLKVAAPNKIDLNGFGLEVKGTLSAYDKRAAAVGGQRHACRRHDGADSCPPRNGQGAENRYKYAPRPRGVERKHRAARIRRRKRGRDDGSYLRKQLCVQGRIQNRRRRSGHYAHPQRRQV